MVIQLPLSPLSVLFLLSTGLLLATAAMTFVAGGTPEVRRWLLALMMADAMWALASVLQLEAASESVAFVATTVWLVTSGAAATLWFLFAVVYTGREPLVTRRRLAVLVAPLIAHAVAFATNPLHGASVSGFTASTRPVTTVVGFSYGPVYATATLYALLLTVVGTALVAETALRDPELYADQSLALVVGAVMPIAGVVLSATGMSLPGVQDVGETSYTPATLSVTAVCYGYALLRTDLLAAGPLVASEGRQVAVESLEEGFVIVDGLGQVIDANAAARELLSTPTLVGRELSAVLPEEATSVDTTGETTVRTDDGAILAAMASDLDDDGRPNVGRAVMLRDVTERERREERLQVLNRVLRHNLRNDINVVRGFAEQIARQELGSMSETAAARRIVDRADSLIGVAEKARTVERLLDAGATVERGPVALAELVEERTREAAAEADRDVRLVVDTPETCRIRSNGAVVGMVCRELFDNAVRHSDRERPTVRVSLTVDESVRLRVADDGPGIPDEDREAVLSGDETQLAHGSRLGLWTVRWGVRYLGGELDIRDRSPTGTVVDVCLPRDASTSFAASAAPESDADPHTERGTDPTAVTAESVDADAGPDRSVAGETPSPDDRPAAPESGSVDGSSLRSTEGSSGASPPPVEEVRDDAETG
ncbi:hypothetical protein BRD13_07215 [Halobacteriales archaeon SW_5_70_135]|nr:MAG: hypothetical protein BRD13_07215 [Halobacteriales archaeon SW_5_70_135]